MEEQKQHFLVVILPGQGHINPSHSLAKRISRATGSHVTFSTAISAHRRMFPSLSNPSQEISNGPITYIPYSDGYDNGVNWSDTEYDPNGYSKKFNEIGSNTLSSILDDLSKRERPVTYIVYSMMMYWVKDLALARDIPTAFYWIQPATVLGIYYHYFHGYRDLIASHADDPDFVVEFPHLPPLKIRDLPSNETFKMITESFRLMIESLLKPDKLGANPLVLINTFEELEGEALKSVGERVEVLPIGPDMPLLIMEENETASSKADLFKIDEKDYIEWLDGKTEKSVVYISFGSILTMSKRQLEEMQRGLQASRRPYLWVVRKDNIEGAKFEEDDDENGMVVEWCDQVKVLSHPSVGCVVTHCGWNSILESLACGVPIVGVPQWSDQHTSARLAVDWGVGLRGKVNGGVLEAEELVSCLETIMGDGERGVEMRKSSEKWRAKAREAMGEGGSSNHVTSEVEGEHFKAHKYVLAARSSVVSAQFSGLMNLKATDRTSISSVHE